MKPPRPVLVHYSWPDVCQLSFNTSIKVQFKPVLISYMLLLLHVPPVVQKRTSCLRTDATKWVWSI